MKNMSEEDLKKLKEQPKINPLDNNNFNDDHLSNDELQKIGMNKSNTSLFPPFLLNKHADQRSYHSFFSSQNSNNPDK